MNINTQRIETMLAERGLASNDMVVPAEYLDADPFALNTPEGEVDLRTGKLTPGQYALSVPDQPDVTTMEIDGQEEAMLSSRGVVLFCYLTWLDEQNEGARGALRRFCEYIAAHGYKGGAAKALAELDALGRMTG